MILSNGYFTPTPSVLRPAEEDLLEQTHGERVIWCGRAATALKWAYQIACNHKQACESTSEIIMPSMCCTTPMNVALSLGIQPRLADVDPNTGLMNVEYAQARLTPSTCAVVFVHLFGQTMDLCTLASWCRENNLLLIEDAAQAQGACFPDGQKIGSVGDMTVYSFNATKILDCGGGALLIRNPEYVSWMDNTLLSETLAEELTPDVRECYAKSYSGMHHGLVTLYRMHPESVASISRGFLEFRSLYDRLYVQSLAAPDRLAEHWRDLPGRLARRLEKATIYAQHLEGGPWHLLNGWRESGVCFRYSLLVNAPNRLVAFSEAVRGAGFHVSNLYWPMDQFFSPDDVCPNANHFGRSIVNLWVDDSVSRDWAKRCADTACQLSDMLIKESMF